MRDTKLYLVPDYYPYFHCKMGACRHACCDGWPISITMKDYFRLVGVSCSPELRQRLDRALHIVQHPVDEAYAEISPSYDGTCPLRIEDGRCGLQAELGEDALSTVCRLYPRGIRDGKTSECSCANSCEAVIELFLNRREPLRFMNLSLDFDLPPFKKVENLFPTAGHSQEIRLYYIRIMQDRSQKIPARLMSLGMAMQEIEKAIRSGDEQLDLLLSRNPGPYKGTDEEPGQEQLDKGMEIASALLKKVDERSRAVREYGEEALNWFEHGENSIERYRQAVSNFENVLSEWEIVFEHMIVNHMFFEQFPFQDRPVPVADEFLAICAVYTLLRFLSVSWLAMHPAQTDFVDVTSALFRLVEHTAFDSFAAGFFKEIGVNDPVRIYDLVRL